MTSQQSNRKNEHVHLSEKFYSDKHSSLHDIRFVHHSLKGIATEDISLSQTVGDFDFKSPFYINAMTGGNDWTGKINKKLAQIARETGLAMAVGSMSVALREKEALASFQIVREVNPQGIIFANLGAHHPLENAKKVVALLKADAIQIHLNSPQEIIMPEGDRDFSQWLNNIDTLVNHLEVPVIVKEVGFGMTRETIKLLEEIGVKYIDISGTGGTNFAKIENFRRTNFKLNELESWGQSTAESLMEAQVKNNDTHIFASGGIRSPQDILKALALGADMVGLSSQFLHMVIQSEDLTECVKVVHQWKDEMIKTMTLLGAQTPKDLKNCDLLLSPDLVHYCQLRGLDWQNYAQKDNLFS